MTFGEKIVHLRKKNRMTQEELGKKLNVTYQAVSKWERGESLPDLATLSQIAKLFNVSLNYFDENGEAEQEEIPKPIATEPVNNNYIGTCTMCGKMLKESDEYTAHPKILCKSCAEREQRLKQIEKQTAEQRQVYAHEQARKNQLGSGFDVKLILSLILALVGYVVLTVKAFTDSQSDEYFYGVMILVLPLALFGLVHAVGDLINDLRDKDDGPNGYTRNLSMITGGAFAVINIIIYLIMYLSFGRSGFFIGMIFIGAILSFTFISQFMWGNVIKEIFTCGGFTFKLPGFIFSLDIDSIIWMILTKIFLGILSILVFIVTTILFAVIAILGSVFTFIPAVIIKTAKDKKASATPLK